MFDVGHWDVRFLSLASECKWMAPLATTLSVMRGVDFPTFLLDQYVYQWIVFSMFVFDDGFCISIVAIC